MKPEKYYDLKCDVCGRHLSTDFNTGMFSSREECLKTAKIIKFKDTILGTTCPICRKNVFKEDIDCSRWNIANW